MKIGLGLDIVTPRGTGGPAAPPAIARVLKGSSYNWDDVNGAGTITVAGVTLAAGSTLVVLTSTNAGSFGPAAGDVKWGATNLLLGPSYDASGNSVQIWYLENVPGDTRDVTLDAMATAFPLSAGMIVLELTGAKAASYDESASSAGALDDPSIGPTGATDQANEMAIGAIQFVSSDINDDTGTYAEGYTAGDRVGSDEAHTNFTLEESYKLLTAAGAQTASKTGTPNTGWQYVLATFRSA